MCFKSPRDPCPLPYCSQASARMDGFVHKEWFKTVFLPAVRDRTRLPCILIVDNCGAHGELNDEQVTFFPLPPNVTSLHQPLDAGIIASLKRRYQGRLLGLVIGAFERFRLRSGAWGQAPTRASDPCGVRGAAAGS